MPDLNSTGPEARALVPEHLQQLLAVCEELHHLDFYGLRSGAKVLLHELLPGARLEFLAEPPAAGDPDGAAADGSPPVRRSGWHFAPPEPQIGRASCRERVEISGVAGGVEEKRTCERECERVEAA